MGTTNHFFRVSSASQVGKILADRIALMADRGPVLWLVSGGSATELAVDCANGLKNMDLSNLTVSLVDERFGPVGHADSNWHQLNKAGFSLPSARLKPYLKAKNFDQTLADLNSFFGLMFNNGVYKIGLLGMGADGHTAGILPNSPAVSDDKYVTGYKASDYRRLTLSLKALHELDETFLYAVGDAKEDQLSRLATKQIEPAVQPAQIIKALPRWAVYNDRIGEEI